MAEHGGYRPPANPAPVSGPGALSQRTDGTQPAQYIAGGDYGDGGLMDLQGGAALAAGPAVAPVPLSAETQRPNEPVTAGAPIGPGPNELPLPGDPDLEWAKQLLPYLPTLTKVANGPTGSPSMRAMVRKLKGLSGGVV